VLFAMPIARARGDWLSDSTLGRPFSRDLCRPGKGLRAKDAMKVEGVAWDREGKGWAMLAHRRGLHWVPTFGP